MATDKSITDFVLDSATTTAERVLADRQWFVLSDRAWDDFNSLLDAPPPHAPRLESLLREPTVFDADQ